jgi:exopolysaccharide biosynthesis polyprenyl glycosylphosphotransferase
VAPVRRNRPGSVRLARLAVALADGATLAAAMVAAYWLRNLLHLDDTPGVEGSYLRVGVVAVPLCLLVFGRYRLFDARHVTGRREELGRIMHAVGVGAVAAAMVALALNQRLDRSWFVLFFVVAMAGVVAEREAARRAFARLRRRGHLLRPVVIVGVGPEALALATMMGEQPELGYRVVGLLGDPDMVEPDLRGVAPVLDARAKVAEQVRLVGAGGVIVATTDVDLQTANKLTRSLTDAGIHVEMSSSLSDIDATRLSVRPLGRFPVVYVEPVKRDGWRPVAKRAFDMALSALALLLALPLLLVVAALIKLTSPGPVMFRQERVGYLGRRFFIFKLRTMYVDGDERLQALAEVPDGPVPKLKHDPRVTPVGHVLRKLSLDELPQLLNVFRGEMSLVGPRPEQPSEVVLWTPELFERLRARPGITGAWQVNGRSDARHAKDRLDLYYVDNWSITHDLAILLRTIPVVLSRKGAY